MSSTGPTTGIIAAVQALARHRGLNDNAALERLANRALRDGVADLFSLRTWVGTSPVLGEALRAGLRRALPPRDDLRYGSTRIVGHLAVGGMGDVWLGLREDDDLCVVKTMRQEVASDEFGKRFDREIRLTVEIASPYVVRCLEHGIGDDGQPYLCLEYISGGDLSHLIGQHGRLEEAQAVLLISQVARGLHAAHGLDLVHRDIKPKNVFIADDCTARLGDFGLARSTLQGRSVLTMTGMTVGTPAYMAPEQVRGEPSIDIRADIYALGIVLFECLTGQPPFNGNQMDLLHHHIHSPVPDIRRLVPSLSKRTWRIISACLAKDPARRFPTPGHLVHSLDKTLRRLGTKNFDQTLNPAMVAAARPKATLDNTQVHGLSESGPAPTPFARQAGPVAAPVAPVAAVAAPVAPVAQCAPASTLVQPSDRHEAGGHPGDWLVLRGHGNLQGHIVHLFAKPRLVVGKLRSPPVDLCLRAYPIDVHADACRRISRQHLALLRDSMSGRWLVEDLGSANGSLLAGRALPRQQPVPLTATARLEVPNAICVDLNPGPGALTITRPDNRPQMAYIMVAETCTIGAGAADLSLPGPVALTIARRQGHWQWRGAPDQPWGALEPDHDFAVAGLPMTALAGDYAFYS